MTRTLSDCEKLLFQGIAHINHLDFVRIVKGTILTKILLWIGRALEPGVGAVTIANYVFIEEGVYTADYIALIAHECVHVDQFLASPVRFCFAYLCDALTKYDNRRCEKDAYLLSDRVYLALTVKYPEMYQCLKENNKTGMTIALMKIRR
jgi:hypothetical protein